MRTVRRALLVGTIPLVFAGVMVAATTSAFAAKSSNAVSQFSTKSNPHGAWSYAAAGSLLNNPIPKDFCGPKKLSAWNNNMGVPNQASVAANKTGAPLACTANGTVTVPAETLNLDPESASYVAVIWTAKKAGTYTVAGQFTGDDSGQQSHTVAILHNATSIYSNTISSHGQIDTFSQSVAVAKGDTLSFTVDTGGGPNNLSTGLQATVS
jgi:hypothetical protein